MRCLNCRRTIPSTIRFCAYCGTSTVPTPPPPPPPTVPPPPAGMPEKIVAWVAAHRVHTGVAAFAAIGLLAVVLLIGGNGDGNGPPPPRFSPAPTEAPAPPPPVAPTQTPTPTATPVPANTTVPTPPPTPTHTPTIEPTETPVPTATTTPTLTPAPTETPTPQPTPTLTPTPTPTLIPTPSPTPKPTATPTLTPTPAPTATPTHTPTPTRPALPPKQECTFKHGETTHKYEIRDSECWILELEDAPSARGRHYVNVIIVDVEDGEGRWDFYDRVRGQRRVKAPGFADYKLLPGRGEGHYIHGEYIWQPRARDCRYHVVEHAHPSWNAPDDYGFVVSMGVCEADRPVYDRQRELILRSFDERE